MYTLKVLCTATYGISAMPSSYLMEQLGFTIPLQSMIEIERWCCAMAYMAAHLCCILALSDKQM